MYKESNWGPSTKVQLGDDYDYMIKVDHLSNFDPRNPDDCKEYTEDDFENCVDEELQDLWKPSLGCNPPWLYLLKTNAPGLSMQQMKLLRISMVIKNS